MNSFQCPRCKSKRTIVNIADFDAETTIFYYFCTDCGEEWQEKYKSVKWEDPKLRREGLP